MATRLVKNRVETQCRSMSTHPGLPATSRMQDLHLEGSHSLGRGPPHMYVFDASTRTGP